MATPRNPKRSPPAGAVTREPASNIGVFCAHHAKDIERFYEQGGRRYIKVAFAVRPGRSEGDRVGTEHMWVEVPTFEHREGTLANDPAWARHLRCGDRVRFAFDAEGIPREVPAGAGSADAGASLSAADRAH